jgi:hypothetical protein
VKRRRAAAVSLAVAALGVPSLRSDAAQLNLSWTPYTPSAGIDIRVARDAGGGFPFLGATPATSSTFADTSVSNAIQYCYRLTAFRSADGAESVPSNTACGMPGPTNLLLTPGTAPNIVTITQPAAGATLAHGPVLLKGTTPAGMATLMVRVNNVGVTPLWNKTTGAWSVTRTLTRLGIHVVGVAVWSASGQVTSTYSQFTIN